MREAGLGHAKNNVLPSSGSFERPGSILKEIEKLDEELLQNADTRQLIEMGAQFMGEVTMLYGTPDRPLWHKGPAGQKPMAYHNGGEDGHTSVGANGIGVPRAVLLIAEAVNRAAQDEVYSPLERALGFYAASSHDLVQNSGRSLLPIGEMLGDERLSAEIARTKFINVGGDKYLGQIVFDEIMATAFNPASGSQNISYSNKGESPAKTRELLGQELVASADLLSLTHPRGLLCSVENIVESLASGSDNNSLQSILKKQGIARAGYADTGGLLDIISNDPGLRENFSELMGGVNNNFFTVFKFSDSTIKEACGQGIDELFTGRQKNTEDLMSFSKALKKGAASPKDIWLWARLRAGYKA